MRDMSITDRIFDFIVSEVKAKGRPPTLREIADACYVSTGAVVRHLDRLEMQGRIERMPGKSRSIRVVTRSDA